MKKRYTLIAVLLILAVFLVGTAEAKQHFIRSYDGIEGTPIGATDPSTGVFSTLSVEDSKVTRIPVPLAGVVVDGTGPITSATAPSLSTVDGVGAIVWDNSTEYVGIQFPWYPDVNFTAMSVKFICTSSLADGTSNGLDWSIFVHGNDLPIPSAVAQDAVAFTSETLDTSEELVTLTLNATGLAAVTAGTSAVTIEVWNDSDINYTTEIKKIWIEETRSY